jgi:hypothetical protein
MKKVLIKEEVHYSIVDAAKILEITKPKVRELLGKGDLKSAQIRMNGKIYVTAKSIVEYKYPGAQ